MMWSISSACSVWSKIFCGPKLLLVLNAPKYNPMELAISLMKRTLVSLFVGVGTDFF